MLRGRRLAWSRLRDLGCVIDWNQYKEYLLKTHHKSSLRYLLTYAKRYCYILENPAEAKDLLMMNDAKRRLVMSSLSSLSKYLGVYHGWKNTIKEFGLKWDKPDPLSSILSLLNTNLDDTKEWLFKALEKLPKDASTTVSFIALTGLRIVEACNSISLVTKLSEQNKLDEYLDRNLMMLQHFKYPQFLRKSKNAYISFISNNLLELILRYKPSFNHDDLKSRIRKRGLRIQLKFLRKMHGTLLRDKGIPSEFIDILHGRVNSSVFARCYYRPLLREMRVRVMEAIRPLEKEILSYF